MSFMVTLLFIFSFDYLLTAQLNLSHCSSSDCSETMYHSININLDSIFILISISPTQLSSCIVLYCLSSSIDYHYKHFVNFALIVSLLSLRKIGYLLNSLKKKESYISHIYFLFFFILLHFIIVVLQTFIGTLPFICIVYKYYFKFYQFDNLSNIQKNN